MKSRGSACALPTSASEKYFVCTSCGNVESKWLGRCPQCSAFDSLKEETVPKHEADEDPLDESLLGSSDSSLSSSSWRSQQTGGGYAVNAAKRAKKRALKYREEHGLDDNDKVGSNGSTKHTVRGLMSQQSNKPMTLGEVQSMFGNLEEERLELGQSALGRDLKRVLGGGIVPGSLTLIGGDPGKGKSTLTAQITGMLASEGHSVLYVSGEEALDQVGSRAERVGIPTSVPFLSSSEMDEVLFNVLCREPEVVVIDSIQAMHLENAPYVAGNDQAVRNCTSAAMNVAKRYRIAFIFIGHVTKEGAFAGPQTLAHMVDATLYMQGDEGEGSTRILRGQKNRFGPNDEAAFLEMGENGLQPLSNPHQLYLAQNFQHSPGVGSALTCKFLHDSSKAVMLEVQTLCTRRASSQKQQLKEGEDDFGEVAQQQQQPAAPPTREGGSFPRQRLRVLLAILASQVLGSGAYGFEIFMSVAGGQKVGEMEKTTDLGALAALTAAMTEQEVPRDVAFIGEVDVSGSLRWWSKVRSCPCGASVGASVPNVLGHLGQSRRVTAD